MICTPVWHTYELRYIHNDHAATIILSAPYTIGWVGIGFSGDGMMVGSSAMVRWINKHGQPRIKQFYLRDRKQSEVIGDKGELPLNNVPAAVAINGAEIHLAFQLQMTTPFEKQPILLAFSSKYPQNHHLSKHDDKTAIVFDCSSGSMGPASHEWVDSDEEKSWNSGPSWITTLLQDASPYTSSQSHRHLCPCTKESSDIGILLETKQGLQDSKNLELVIWYHSWLGRLALFFAAMNIVLGMQASGAGSDWKIVYGFLVSILVIASIILEVLAYLKRSEMRSLPPNFQIDPVGGEATFPSHIATG